MKITYHPQRMARLGELYQRRFKKVYEANPQFKTLLAIPGFIEAQVIKQEFSGWTQEAIADREGVKSKLESLVEALKATGNNIFDMSQLVALFRHTDVEDVELSEVPTPYNVLYLHFGESANLRVADDLWIEGVYVSTSRGSENVPETGGLQLPHAKGLILFFVCSHPDWEMAPEVPLGETLLRSTRAACTVLLDGRTIEQSIAEYGGFTEDGLVCENTAVMTEALRMTVNSLLYLDMPRNDIEEGYPEGAPPDLVEKANRPNIKARRKLEALGFVRVKFAGRRTMQLREPGGQRSVGQTKATHWRRGHWRLYAVGVGRTLRKRIWRRPGIVNGHRGALTPGRVYEVDQPLDPGQPHAHV